MLDVHRVSNSGTKFRDRRDAGRRLAVLLDRYRGTPGLLVLALPRGGVPVGAEVAHALGAPLDVLLVRKIGIPGHEETAMGAVALGGPPLVNWRLVQDLGIPVAEVRRVVQDELRELERRAAAYLPPGRPAPDVSGRTVLLVDDGLATGATVTAAVESVRASGAARIIVAVPVASVQAVAALRPLVDDVACVVATPRLDGVGSWYGDFRQVTDAEVRSLLAGPDAGPLRPGSAR